VGRPFHLGAGAGPGGRMISSELYSETVLRDGRLCRPVYLNVPRGRPNGSRGTGLGIGVGKAKGGAPAGAPPFLLGRGGRQKATTPSTMKPWNLPPLRMSLVGKAS